MDAPRLAGMSPSTTTTTTTMAAARRSTAPSSAASTNKSKRQKGEKLIREMLEHAIVCRIDPRSSCSECVELRNKLKVHASICTRAACSMPFCGVGKPGEPIEEAIPFANGSQTSSEEGVLQIRSQNSGEEGMPRARSRDGGNEDGGIRIRLSKPIPVAATTNNGFAPPISQYQSDASFVGLPHLLDKTSTISSQPTTSSFLSTTAWSQSTTTSAPINGLPGSQNSTVTKSLAEGVIDESSNHVYNNDDDSNEPFDGEASTGPTESTAVVGDSNGLSQVTMEGNFDGRLTFSGKWFHNDSEDPMKRPFGYVYKDEDLSDPDGTLPCQECKSLSQLDEPDDLDFVVCDLCDHVFHLRCAGLETIPENAYYCRSCTDVRAKLVPPEAGSTIKLPPTRQWTGYFLIGDRKVHENFRLEFKWRKMAEGDGVIADVIGKGSNYFGDFSIIGQLGAPVAPRYVFPLKLTKNYVPMI